MKIINKQITFKLEENGDVTAFCNDTAIASTRKQEGLLLLDESELEFPLSKKGRAMFKNEVPMSTLAGYLKLVKDGR